MPDWVPGVLTAVILSVPGILVYLAERRKAADAQPKTIAEAYTLLSNDLQEERNALRTERDTLRAELNGRIAEVQKLQQALADKNGMVLRQGDEIKTMKRQIAALHVERRWLREQFEEATGKRLDTKPLKLLIDRELGKE